MITSDIIHDYLENERRILEKRTNEKIESFYIKEIERLNNIINKAIEYIQQLTNDEESIELMDINSLVQEELSNILKGSDKE